jgi:hypothetical protein
LPINFGALTCSCGEGIGDGHSELEGELIVGDLNKGVKWLVNVLRSADGEFGKMAVQKNHHYIVPCKPKKPGTYKLTMLLKVISQATNQQVWDLTTD